jgi:hypothetical protein
MPAEDGVNTPEEAPNGIVAEVKTSVEHTELL